MRLNWRLFESLTVMREKNHVADGSLVCDELVVTVVAAKVLGHAVEKIGESAAPVIQREAVDHIPILLVEPHVRAPVSKLPPHAIAECLLKRQQVSRTTVTELNS
jgi:hypothetical protein